VDFNLLSSTLESLNQPKYRLKQITDAYYSGHFKDWLAVTSLSLDLRQYLQSQFPLYSLSVEKTLTSSGTQKILFKTADDQYFESVLMQYPEWNTVCLSTQIGCPLNCAFCATGKMGFKRNLTAEEIVEQVILWKNQFPVDRLVFMGMGEPFLNYSNLKLAIETINTVLKIGSRKISVSTAGIIPQIKQFALDFPQINLAISLHAINQSTRLKIMPITQQYPLNELLDQAKNYVSLTRRQLFFEYALFEDINDSPQDIASLAKFIKSNYLFYLNLIPVNQVPNGLKASTKLTQIVNYLTQNQVDFSVRQSFGQEINSACGQLAYTTGKI